MNYGDSVIHESISLRLGEIVSWSHDGDSIYSGMPDI